MRQQRKTCKSWILLHTTCAAHGKYNVADQPLRELYGLLHGDTLPDGEALSRTVTAVLEKGAEIIRLAEEERRKYEDG